MSGMAVALLVAIINVFGLPTTIIGSLSTIGNGVFIWMLTGEVLPVQTLAAIFVTAFLGLLIRTLSGPDTPTVVRRLRKQVPDL